MTEYTFYLVRTKVVKVIDNDVSFKLDDDPSVTTTFDLNKNNEDHIWKQACDPAPPVFVADVIATWALGKDYCSTVGIPSTINGEPRKKKFRGKNPEWLDGDKFARTKTVLVSLEAALEGDRVINLLDGTLVTRFGLQPDGKLLLQLTQAGRTAAGDKVEMLTANPFEQDPSKPAPLPTGADRERLRNLFAAIAAMFE